MEAYGLTPGGSLTPGGGGRGRLAPPAVGGGGGMGAAAAPAPAAAPGSSRVVRALPRRAHMTLSRVFFTFRLPWSALHVRVRVRVRVRVGVRVRARVRGRVRWQWSALHALSASALRWKVTYAQSLPGCWSAA